MPDRRIRSTTSLCRTCKASVPAELVVREDTVVLRKRCPTHGEQEALVSSSARWYLDTIEQLPQLEPPQRARPVDRGCPFDCGPCAAHEQRLHLPIVPITSACNLDCPICYTHNRNDDAYHMSEAELRATLEHLRRLAPERRILNITGGEPTQHPALLRLLKLCADEGIDRVTLSTHGLRFLKDEPLVRGLAELGTRVVLSFDSFRSDVNRTMLGGNLLDPKLQILDVLERHGVDTTLVPVLGRGLNDAEVGKFVDLALRRDFIRSVEFHPLTFTGQGGTTFDRAARYTTYDALRDIEVGSGGALEIADFVPSPAAHPLCYLVAYLLRVDDGHWVPLRRFMPREDLRALLEGGLYLMPSPAVERTLADVINRLWAGEIRSEHADVVLPALRRLTEDVFAPRLSPAQRLRRAERHTKAIYIHTHMDEETFDTDRIRQCCVGIPGADGTSIPSCAYNVLYRERDARFMPTPKPDVVTLGRGRV